MSTEWVRPGSAAHAAGLAAKAKAAGGKAASAGAGGPAQKAVKYLGVSEPVSVAPPGPADEKRTAELMTFLEQNKRFESRADKQHRETVLTTLGAMLSAWVKNVSLALDPPIVDPASHRAHLFSFGSYRLGVNARDADIDTVCIVPAHIDMRRDFFGLSEEGSEEPDETGNVWRNSDKPECILQDAVENHPMTENLVAVVGAFTPILTFDFNGVEIDIACGIVAHKTLPAVRTTATAPHPTDLPPYRPSSQRAVPLVLSTVVESSPSPPHWRSASPPLLVRPSFISALLSPSLAFSAVSAALGLTCPICHCRPCPPSKTSTWWVRLRRPSDLSTVPELLTQS